MVVDDVVVFVELLDEKTDFRDRSVLFVIPLLEVAVKWRVITGPAGQLAVLS